MGKRGPEGLLDEGKRKEVCAVLTIGGSQAQAARYVGCSPGTISNTAKRDPTFATRIRRAKVNCEKECLRNIFHCGVKSWRASAWLLERTRPEMYEKASVRRASAKQLDSFWDESADDILLDLPEEQQELLRGRFTQARKKFAKAAPAGGRRGKAAEAGRCEMEDPMGEPEAAEREPAGAGGQSAGAGGRSAAQAPAELTLPPACPPTPLGLPGGQPQDSPAKTIEEQRAAARLESLLNQDDQAANRDESCLWHRKPDMPNLAIMPGFANPLASPDDEEDDSEGYAKAVRGCEQLGAMKREYKLRQAAAAEEARQAKTIGNTAIVGLLLAWLSGWLFATSRPDFQYVRLSSLTNAASICQRIAPPKTTLASSQRVRGWRAVSAGLRIRPTAERESSAPPAGMAGALRLRADNLERLPHNVPCGAFKVNTRRPDFQSGRIHVPPSHALRFQRQPDTSSHWSRGWTADSSG